MTQWTEARFRLERFSELGMAVRRRTAPSPEGTLLYLHGLGESGLCFERVMCDPRLDRYTHVVPDLIGYGKSSWAERPLTLERHAAGLDLLLDRLGIDRVTLVGHSMGGVLGLYLADRRRSRVEALVNVEGNISLDDCTGSAEAAAQTLETWLETGFDAFVEGLCEPTDPEDPSQERSTVLREYAASARMADPRAFHRNSRDLVNASAEETLAPRLAALDVPQVYVHGVPRGTGTRSLSLLQDAGVPCIGLEPAGHWPYRDRFDAFVDVLADFLHRPNP